MKMLLARNDVKYRLYVRRNLLDGSRTGIARALFVVLLLLFTNVLGCERATKLTIEGTSPPKFIMTGNGSLTTVRLVGPDSQREASGEEASVYWLIKSEKPLSVDEIGTVTYGQVPEGYSQVYPERGTPPPLVDGVRYNVRINTTNAPGAYQLFTIKDGRVTVIYSQ